MHTTLKARWIFPVCREPIENGIVRIKDDRIVAVEQGRAGEGVRDLGNVALLPGLINAHTHLELSGIDTPLGRRGIPFVDWIGRVVARRGVEDYDPADAVCRGLEACEQAGVAAVGDIVQPSTKFPETSVAVTRFLELIGPTEARAAEALRLAEVHVGAGQGRGAPNLGESTTNVGQVCNLSGQDTILSYGRTRTAPSFGLSPHAPYSTRPELIEGACRLSRQHGLPVAFHLAESREEMQLLRDGTGPFRELLQRLDAWDPAVQHAGRRPLGFLKLLAEAHRTLVIHGNYLDEEEIAFVAERRDRMSVVYCPRTHAWFPHDPYPLESMLEQGVNVALGTDSRASSPDLNLLEEMRAAARSHPNVPRSKIVEMGTMAGAKALGIEADYGSIEVGKVARFAAVELSEQGSDDPYRLLLG